MAQEEAIIIGAGPAGLTAAHELLQRTDIKPVVLETSQEPGGTSRTVNYKGNRMDLMGHRFYSRSRRVMDWWRQMLPMQGKPARDDRITGRFSGGEAASVALAAGGPDPDQVDRVMLMRQRFSRLYHRRRLFNFPLTLDQQTVRSLGWFRTARAGVSYAGSRLRPTRGEHSLEDLLINRYGRHLYTTLYRDYTEKIWGVPCDRIRAEPGTLPPDSLHFTRALSRALRGAVQRSRGAMPPRSENRHLERFLYPKLGPGQMWEEVAGRVREKGGEIRFGERVTGIRWSGDRVKAVEIADGGTGKTEVRRADYFLSTIPLRDLIEAMGEETPAEARQVAAGLGYRDLIVVGSLLRGLRVHNQTGIRTANDLLPDNWIYVQEPGLKVARLQIYNNWSPYMVATANMVWLGMEYFCTEGDELWARPDREIRRLAVKELSATGLIDAQDVIDMVVVRVPRAYPTYFGTYDRFHELRHFVDGFENLFLIGRNGMHRYAHADHAVLTAMTAVDNMAAGVTGKDNIWNTSAGADHPARQG